METINLHTNQRNEFVNITQQVQKIVHDSGTQNGIILLHIPHTTAAITINENADPDVVDDILLKINEVIDDDPRFQHREGNSDSHIKSSLFGPTLSLIISEGEILLGTWQGVYFCEFDGPRNRKVYLKILKT